MADAVAPSGMPACKAPEPEYVVLCSDAIDWHGDAELVATYGQPMLLHGSSARDFDFVQDLVKKHDLKSSLDRRNQKYLLWKNSPMPVPAWTAS